MSKVADAPAAGSAGAGRRWLGPLRTLSWVVVVGILVQAVLAGQGLFQSAALFELHGFLGSAVLLVSAGAAVLSFLARSPLWLRLASLAVTGGLFVQTGLGYAGRRSGVAAASMVHVPLGWRCWASASPSRWSPPWRRGGCSARAARP